MNKSFIHDYAELYYEIIGEGFPILHLHGFELEHHVMKNSLEPLYEKRKGIQRIYLDLPSMGRSIAKEGLKTADNMVAVISAFADLIIPKQEFAIVGFSYGGYLARWFVKYYAQYVKNVFSFCPVIVPQMKDRDLPPFRVETQENDFLASLDPYDYAAIKNWLTVQTKTVYEYFQQDIENYYPLGQKLFMDNYKKHGYSFKEDIDQSETLFTAKTVFVCGREDIVVGYMDAVRLSSKYQYCDVHILSGAGHFLEREKQEKFELLFTDWLTKINSE